MQKVGTLIRKHVSAPMPALIKKLNAVLRGWANYHRHVVASEAFKRIDTYVYDQLWRMIRRRHSQKSGAMADPKNTGRPPEGMYLPFASRPVKKTISSLTGKRHRNSTICEDQSGCESLPARIRRILLASSEPEGQQAAACFVGPRI